MNSKLYVEIDGQGKPLILLHGWGWHSGIWKPIVERLTAHFKVFMVDLPGFGKSPLSINSYSCEAVAEQIFEVVPEQASWLGWSLGGMLAWWITIHHPRRVTRLITVAASPKFVADENWPGVAPQTLDKFRQALIDDHEKTLHEFLELQLRGSVKIPDLPCFANGNMEGLYGGLQLLQTIDLRAHLKEAHCPSLHIFGSHDVLVPKQVTNIIQPQLKHGQCKIIQRTGHIPFLTHPDEFLNQLLF